ncbi:MAG: T9SS type A sorting domain-containing protein [Candidatus Nomurabacteria bacterium]|nr:T9SS type A sorting domain-containing protein [Candidatus Nomurabacteria bacterium]
MKKLIFSIVFIFAGLISYGQCEQPFGNNEISTAETTAWLAWQPFYVFDDEDIDIGGNGGGGGTVTFPGNGGVSPGDSSLAGGSLPTGSWIPHSYEIEWTSISTGISSSAIWTGVTNYTITDLSPGECYVWQVREICDILSGTYTAWSGLDTFCTTPCTYQPQTMTSDISASKSGLSISLSWTPVVIINGGPQMEYDIRIQQVPDTSWSIFDPLLPTPAGFLTENETYIWQVRRDCGQWSRSDTFTTTMPDTCGLEIENTFSHTDGKDVVLGFGEPAGFILVAPPSPGTIIIFANNARFFIPKQYSFVLETRNLGKKKWKSSVVTNYYNCVDPNSSFINQSYCYLLEKQAKKSFEWRVRYECGPWSTIDTFIAVPKQKNGHHKMDESDSVLEPEIVTLPPLYPNPTNGFVILRGSAEEITVYNISGQKVLQRIITDTSMNLDLSSGIYLYQIDDGRVHKIIITK